MDTPAQRSGRASAAALVVAVALAACGGDDSASTEAETAAAPTFPRALAEELAVASDDVAQLLEAGDGCAASKRAAELREQALAAVDSGDVPPELERPLVTAVERLASRIVCEPASTEDDDEDDDERGKGKAKGKDKDKKNDEDEDDDDSPNGTTTTETVETTTEEG
jgi:hypothetical protein